MHDTRAHIVLLKLADADACVNLILERHLLVADGREIFFYRLSRILLGLKLGLHLNLLGSKLISLPFQIRTCFVCSGLGCLGRVGAQQFDFFLHIIVFLLEVPDVSFSNLPGL